MTRDSINLVLLEAGLGGRYKCRKVFIDNHPKYAESNVIHDQNNNPVFDCGWVGWERKVQEFIKGKQS